jgi:hypothetical protein
MRWFHKFLSFEISSTKSWTLVWTKQWHRNYVPYKRYKFCSVLFRAHDAYKRVSCFYTFLEWKILCCFLTVNCGEESWSVKKLQQCYCISSLSFAIKLKPLGIHMLITLVHLSMLLILYCLYKLNTLKNTEWTWTYLTHQIEGETQIQTGFWGKGLYVVDGQIIKVFCVL